MYVCDVCDETDEDESRMQHHEAYCLERKKRKDDKRARRTAAGHLTIRQVIDRCGLLERHEALPVRIKDEACARFDNWLVYGTSSYRGWRSASTVHVHTIENAKNGRR